MITYTTPTITLVVEGVVLTAEMDVYASLEQGDVEITKSGEDLTLVDDGTDTTITATLTQEETAAFNTKRMVEVQVNWITSNGTRAATEVKAIPVFKNLLDKVVEYGD